MRVDMKIKILPMLKRWFLVDQMEFKREVHALIEGGDRGGILSDALGSAAYKHKVHAECFDVSDQICELVTCNKKGDAHSLAHTIKDYRFNYHRAWFLLATKYFAIWFLAHIFVEALRAALS